MNCKFCAGLINPDMRASDWFTCYTCNVSYLILNEIIIRMQFMYWLGNKFHILTLQYDTDDSCLLIWNGEDGLNPSTKITLPLLDNVTPNNFVSKIKTLLVFS